MPENNEQQQRPTTVADLVQHLANTLVENEVMKPMESIGWGHGTPPPPVTGDNLQPGGAPPPGQQQVQQTQQPVTTTGSVQAPVQPVKTDTPVDLVAHFESLRDANGMILGKYPDVAAAIKGVGHAVDMAKRAFTERDQLKTELDRLSQQVKAAPTQTPVVTSPVATPQAAPFAVPSRAAVEKAQAAYDEVLSRVVEEGGLLDADTQKALSKAQRELSRAEAVYAAQETLLQRDAAQTQENAKWTAVDEYMNKKYPDAKNFAAEMGLFVQSDPLIGEAVAALAAAGKEIQASELAWTAFERARGNEVKAISTQADQTKEIQLQAADQVRREAVEKARQDAGIISSSASGVHETPNNSPSQDEINAAARAMNALGSTPGNPAAARWRELTIGRSLPPEIFG